MKRKITLLALGAIIAALAARGLANCETPSAATAWLEKKPSLLRRSMRPSEVKPAPACQRNSRRVRPPKEGGGLLEGVILVSYSMRFARAGRPLYVSAGKRNPFRFRVTA